MKRAGLLVLLALQCAPTGCLAGSTPVTVAAAADLQFAMKDIGEAFTRQTGLPARIIYGASGNFTAQIEQGAPFDLFLSADTGYPERLMREGLVEPGSFYRYASGRLVVYVPRESRLDLAHRGLGALLDASVHKIAVANPRTAPYGRAAIAALAHFGLEQKLAGKLVYGENISQAAQFVESGNAQAGILALAIALAPTLSSRGRYWEISPGSYPPLEQAAVIPKGARNAEAARVFLKFLGTKQAQDIFRRYGFDPEGARR